MNLLIMKLYKKLQMTKNLQVYLQRIVNHQFLIGVTGVIFNEKNEVLLFKHSYRSVEWSLPGGYLQSKEHPKSGLEREVLEESGFKIQVIKIIKTTHDPEVARLDLSYYGEFVGGEFVPSAEVTDYQFCDVSKLPPLIEDQYKQIEEGYKKYMVTKRKTFTGWVKDTFLRFRA